MKKIGIISLAVATLIALGLGVYNLRPAQAPVQTPEPVGAVVSTDIPGDSFSVNGMFEKTLQTKMPTTAQSNKVLCAFKTPNNATTTINTLRFLITTGTSTASIIKVATSTSATATSSSNYLTQLSVSATEGIKANYNFPDGLNNNLLYPNQYLLVITENFGNGGSSKGYVYGGKCFARFGAF